MTHQIRTKDINSVKKNLLHMLNSTNRISNCLIYMEIVPEIDVLTYEKYTYIHTPYCNIKE